MYLNLFMDSIELPRKNGINSGLIYQYALTLFEEEKSMTNQEKHRMILDELNKTYVEKNTDYGDSFSESLDEDGLIASSVRMGDKYRRFRTLIDADDILVQDESLRDTLMDLANYAIMTVMWLEEVEEFKGRGGVDMHALLIEKNEEISKLKRINKELSERLEKIEMDYIYNNNKAAEDFRELGEEGAWELFQDSHLNSKKIDIPKGPDSIVDLGYEQIELPLWKIEENEAKKKEDLARMRRIHMTLMHRKALEMNDIYDKKRLHLDK